MGESIIIVVIVVIVRVIIIIIIMISWEGYLCYVTQQVLLQQMTIGRRRKLTSSYLENQMQNCNIASPAPTLH